MLDSLIHSIENTFVQFSFRRLLYILFLLAIVVIALLVPPGPGTPLRAPVGARSFFCTWPRPAVIFTGRLALPVSRKSAKGSPPPMGRVVARLSMLTCHFFLPVAELAAGAARCDASRL